MEKFTGADTNNDHIQFLNSRLEETMSEAKRHF